MSFFADSSAVVARYSPDEADALPGADGIVVSALARVEVTSAFWRKVAAGVLTAEQAHLLLNEFDADWIGTAEQNSVYRPIALTSWVLARAAALTGTHGLRTLDAIQLACALAAREADSECRILVALDQRLRRAAATERFELLPA